MTKEKSNSKKYLENLLWSVWKMKLFSFQNNKRDTDYFMHKNDEQLWEVFVIPI